MKITAVQWNMGKQSNWFRIQSVVRQVCVMSGFVFLLVIDWTMHQATKKSVEKPETGFRHSQAS